MSDIVPADSLADAVMEGLEEYAALTGADMIQAVRKAGQLVRSEIQANAPRDSGKYAKSWTVKVTKESPHSLELTIHSRDRYRLTHLLEHGHAKRNGGRVPGKAHIAPAEEKGVAELLAEIERGLRDG